MPTDDTIREAVATVERGVPHNAHPMTVDDYQTASDTLALWLVRHMNELARVRRDVRQAVVDLAALVPDPRSVDADDWPCQNIADRECLQSAFVRLTELDSDLTVMLEPLFGGKDK